MRDGRSAEQLTQVAVELTTRPLRRAYVLPSDATVEEVLECIAEASSTWGGWGDILVPLSPDAETGVPFHPVFTGLLRRHSPDVIHRVRDLPEGVERRIGQLVGDMPLSAGASTALALPTSGALEAVPRTDLRADHPWARLQRERPPSSLDLLQAAHGGEWVVDGTTTHSGELAGHRRQAPLDREAIEGLVERPYATGPARPGRGTSLDRGMKGCDLFVSSRAYAGISPRILVVVGGGVADFCLYYDLLHVVNGPAPYWLPTDGAARNADEPPGDFAPALWRSTTSIDAASGPWQVTSVSLDEHTALEVVRSAPSADKRLVSNAELRWASPGDGLARQLVVIREPEGAQVAARWLALFEGPELTAPISPPVPRDIAGTSWRDRQWVVGADRHATHPYPSRRCLHRLFTGLPPGSPLGTGRPTRSGAAFTGRRLQWWTGELEGYLTPIALRNPEPSGVAAAIFGEAGLQLQPSANGRFRRETTALFGGIDAFTQVITGPEYHVLRGFVRPEVGRKRRRSADDAPGHAEVVGGWLTSDDEQAQKRWSAEVSDVAMWVASARGAATGICPRCRRPDRRPTGDDQRAAGELVARWLSLGVLRRGMIHRCSVCAATHWYPLEDMDESVRCYRCGRQTHMDVDGKWHYRVQEVVHQAIAQNCHVPVLTVHRLKREAAGTAFEQLEDQEVWHEGRADGPMMELDIVCFVDGQVVLGEAKAEGDVGQNERERNEFARRYLELVDALMPDRLVFATTQDDWDAPARTSLEHIRQEAARYGTRTDIWTRQDFPPGTPA